jgi:hypothetical protein
VFSQAGLPDSWNIYIDSFLGTKPTEIALGGLEEFDGPAVS